jgi:hypothetical protein
MQIAVRPNGGKASGDRKELSLDAPIKKGSIEERNVLGKLLRAQSYSSVG